jgi:butyrate kinase
VEDFLSGSDIRELHAVAGRGGLTRPIEAGSYRVNEAIKEDLRSARYGNHASNLGALIADAIASERGIPSLIADPVGVDQFEELARFSGWPGLERKCQLHALNMREVARRAARDLAAEAAEPGEKRSEDMADYRFIIAHLGGGISIGPMAGGRVIDVNNAMDGGPFSPQRVGSLPTTGLIDLCFSGQYASAKELKAAMTRKGGVFAYLGTDDGREIAERIESGDAKAETVFRAMAYQISKEIGAMAAVLEGRVDAILLTGGLPRPPSRTGSAGRSAGSRRCVSIRARWKCSPWPGQRPSRMRGRGPGGISAVLGARRWHWQNDWKRSSPEELLFGNVQSGTGAHREIRRRSGL